MKKQATYHINLQLLVRLRKKSHPWTNIDTNTTFYTPLLPNRPLHRDCDHGGNVPSVCRSQFRIKMCVLHAEKNIYYTHSLSEKADDRSRPSQSHLSKASETRWPYLVMSYYLGKLRYSIVTLYRAFRLDCRASSGAGQWSRNNTVCCFKLIH